MESGKTQRAGISDSQNGCQKVQSNELSWLRTEPLGPNPAAPPYQRTFEFVSQPLWDSHL